MKQFYGVTVKLPCSGLYTESLMMYMSKTELMTYTRAGNLNLGIVTPNKIPPI